MPPGFRGCRCVVSRNLVDPQPRSRMAGPFSATKSERSACGHLGGGWLAERGRGGRYIIGAERVTAL